MRLIDADKLKLYIDDCEFCYKCPDRRFRCEIECEMPSHLTKQWERAIDEQPTVDAVPIRHGKWMGTVCTACGESTSFYYDCDYCPHCGARMDEE